MTSHDASCHPQLVQRFLADELTREESLQLEDHLSRCSQCQRLLNDSSADELWWTQPAEFLSADPLDEQLASLTDANDADLGATQPTVADGGEYSQAIEHDGLRRVLELLVPSDDPQMLGRMGRYEIVGAIGFGGMAVVLKGFETALRRFVAIKVLASHLASSATARHRFSREARAAASVLHPNVIAIHSVAEFNGLPYLAMPYIAGGSVQDRIDQAGPIDVEATVRIGMQIASGLAAAHEQGLVHRDIKPANILLEPGLERVIITDFGLARAADDASITQTGILAGTPHYMSPEQAKGESVDHRSDLFSLGSVLFTMLTGRVPFRSETSYGVLRKITDQPAPQIRKSNPVVPSWLAKLVQKLHRADPQQRFQSAEEVSKLLAQCLASLQHADHALPQALLSERRFLFRKPVWLSVCLFGLSCLTLALVPPWLNRDREQPFVAAPVREVGLGITPVARVTWPADGKWATLTGRFVWSGEPPAQKQIQPTRDRDSYRDDSILDESLLVNPENLGIANLFIWIEPAGAASVEGPLRILTHPSYDQPTNQVVTARFLHGRIEPHAFTLRSSQTLAIANRDPIPHTIQVGTLLDAVVPEGGQLAREFAVNTKGPAAIGCQFHPWLNSHMLVQDHPYMTVTDSDGHFALRQVPAGTWRVRFWHEQVGNIRMVVKEGGLVEFWDEHGLDLELDRPLVDLGELIPSFEASP